MIPIDYKKYQLIDHTLKKALITFREITKDPSHADLNNKCKDLMLEINNLFDADYDLMTYLANKACVAILAMQDDVFSFPNFTQNGVAANRVNFSLYEEEFIRKNDGKSVANICIREVWKNAPDEKKFWLTLGAAGTLCLTGLLLRLSYVSSRFMMRKALQTRPGKRIHNFIKQKAEEQIKSIKDGLTFKNKLKTVVLYFLFCNFFNFSNSDNTFFNIFILEEIDKKYIDIVKKDYVLNDVLLKFAQVENINPLKLEKLVKLITILEHYIKNPSELNKSQLIRILKYALGKTMGINSDELKKQIEKKMEQVRSNLLPENQEMIDVIKTNVINMSDEEILIITAFVNMLNLAIFNMPELVRLISISIIFENSQKTLQGLDKLSHADQKIEIRAFEKKIKEN